MAQLELTSTATMISSHSPFFTGFAPEAYRLADEFKRRGKRAVAGGPHVTFNPDEALQHVESVVIGAKLAGPKHKCY
jgi:radical SAM superfamily enzyme YgiQ (UPF0313 family)